jgi:hypothetical protein
MAVFSLPKIDLPGVELPDIDADRIASLARDAAYISVGFGVLAFQKAQVRRQELLKQMHASKLPVDQIGKFVGAQARLMEGRFDRFETMVDGAVEQVKDRLPTPADELISQLQTVAKAATKQVRSLVSKAA